MTIVWDAIERTITMRNDKSWPIWRLIIVVKVLHSEIIYHCCTAHSTLSSLNPTPEFGEWLHLPVHREREWERGSCAECMYQSNGSWSLHSFRIRFTWNIRAIQFIHPSNASNASMHCTMCTQWQLKCKWFHKFQFRRDCAGFRFLLFSFHSHLKEVKCICSHSNVSRDATLNVFEVYCGYVSPHVDILL